MNPFKKTPAAAPEAAAPESGRGARKAARKATRKQAPPKKAKAGQPKPFQRPSELSPFLADHTQAGLVDRFAELNKRRSDWVLIALGLVFCLVISLGMNVYQVSKSEVVPFKVVLDGAEGYLLERGVVEPMRNVEGIYIRAELREILRGFRTVYNDLPATSQMFNRSWGRVIGGSPADAFLKDHFADPDHHPIELSGRAQRNIVEFVGPTQLSGTNSWSVQWVERTAQSGNNALSVTEDVYRGSITVDIVPVRDVETAQLNPLGLWVKGIQWEKVSSKNLDLSDLGKLTPLDLVYPDSQRP